MGIVRFPPARSKSVSETVFETVFERVLERALRVFEKVFELARSGQPTAQQRTGH